MDLHERYKEELSDAEIYDKMAEEMNGRAAGVLRDIAEEERQHAKMINYLMQKEMQK